MPLGPDRRLLQGNSGSEDTAIRKQLEPLISLYITYSIVCIGAVQLVENNLSTTFLPHPAQFKLCLLFFKSSTLNNPKSWTWWCGTIRKKTTKKNPPKNPNKLENLGDDVCHWELLFQLRALSSGYMSLEYSSVFLFFSPVIQARLEHFYFLLSVPPSQAVNFQRPWVKASA